jgi:hypothetical protein
MNENDLDRRFDLAYDRLRRLSESDQPAIRHTLEEADAAFRLGIRKLLQAENAIWEAGNRQSA